MESVGSRTGRLASVSRELYEVEGAPGPSLLGTGEGGETDWQLGIHSTTATYDALGRMVEIGSGRTYTQFAYRPDGVLLALYSSEPVKTTIPLPGGSTAIYNSTGLHYIRHIRIPVQRLRSRQVYRTPTVRIRAEPPPRRGIVLAEEEVVDAGAAWPPPGITPSTQRRPTRPSARPTTRPARLTAPLPARTRTLSPGQPEPASTTSSSASTIRRREGGSAPIRTVGVR